MDKTALVITVIGILSGGLGAAIKALADLRPMKAKAKADDASGTSMVVAAARELVDPLRKELAEERRDHAEEIALEREKVAQARVETNLLRQELDAALAEAKELRNELAMARVEADALRREREVDRARIRDLEGR